MRKNTKPGSVRFFRLATEYLVYLFVFLLPWQTKLIIRPSASPYSEISIYLSLAVLVLALLFFLGTRWQDDCSDECKPIIYSLAGAGLFVFISILFAPDKLLACFRYFLVLSAISIFFILRSGTSPRNYSDALFNKSKLLGAFLVGIGLQALLGIWQFLTQQSFAFKYLGIAEHDPAAAGTAVVETLSGRWLRAYGGFDHPNILGGILAIGLIIAAYHLAKRKTLQSGKQLLVSGLLFVFYFISLYALFFSFSRSAWLGFAVGLAILAVHIIKQKDRWFTGRFLALIFFTLALAFAAGMLYKDLISVRIEAQTRLEQKSITERVGGYEEASALIISRPCFGQGIGNYVVAAEGRDAIKRPAWAYQPVHNAFLLLGTESGLFALIAFLIFLGYFVICAKREPYAVAVVSAFFIIMMLDHWVFSLPFGIMSFFLLLGLI